MLSKAKPQRDWKALSTKTLSWTVPLPVPTKSWLWKGRDLTDLSFHSATPAACIFGTRVNYGCTCVRNTGLLPTPKCATISSGDRS